VCQTDESTCTRKGHFCPSSQAIRKCSRSQHFPPSFPPLCVCVPEKGGGDRWMDRMESGNSRFLPSVRSFIHSFPTVSRTNELKAFPREPRGEKIRMHARLDGIATPRENVRSAARRRDGMKNAGDMDANNEGDDEPFFRSSPPRLLAHSSISGHYRD